MGMFQSPNRYSSDHGTENVCLRTHFHTLNQIHHNRQIDVRRRILVSEEPHQTIRKVIFNYCYFELLMKSHHMYNNFLLPAEP